MYLHAFLVDSWATQVLCFKRDFLATLYNYFILMSYSIQFPFPGSMFMNSDYDNKDTFNLTCLLYYTVLEHRRDSGRNNY